MARNVGARPGPRPERRGGWLILAFVAIIALGVALAALLATRISAPSREPFSVRSPEPAGLLGLRLWLEDMGYSLFVPNEGDSSAEPRVVILFPGAELTEDQRANLQTWLEKGNTLVLANSDGLGLPSTFGVMIQARQTYSDVELSTVQPVLPSNGRQYGRVSGRTLSTMTPLWHTVPVLMTENGDAAVLLQTVGKGTVWHIGVNGALTNADLRDGWGRDLMVAALRGVPVGSAIDIVNGEERLRSGLPSANQRTGPDGLWQWLLLNPLGWAFFALAGLVLFYLFTQGRRLGPPVPIDAPRDRRAGVEHILAIAGLAQRAGHRDAVAAYQKARLKRRLGQASRTSVDLDDGAFVAALGEVGVGRDKLDALADLLARMDHVGDEAALVRAVAEANRFSLE